jgi:hypothetical protein
VKRVSIRSTIEKKTMRQSLLHRICFRPPDPLPAAPSDLFGQADGMGGEQLRAWLFNSTENQVQLLIGLLRSSLSQYQGAILCVIECATARPSPTGRKFVEAGSCEKEVIQCVVL